MESSRVTTGHQFRIVEPYFYFITLIPRFQENTGQQESGCGTFPFFQRKEDRRSILAYSLHT
jgi:hypothetical protein